MGLILIGKSLQEQMIDDFILEYEQQRTLDNKPRMYVIEQSIRELREQIKNPERHAKMIHGGYSDEEMKRIENLPRNLNGV